jgi:DNA-binding transcriptional ArsR family regulator
VTTLRLTPACRDVRQRLGPIAWAVLEDVALDAEPDDDGRLSAATSARHIAGHLGLQPGTVARALQRLRSAGLVTLEREHGAGGRFGLSVYRLAAIPGIVVSDRDAPRVVVPHTAAPFVDGRDDVEDAVGAIGPDSGDVPGQQSLWEER